MSTILSSVVTFSLGYFIGSVLHWKRDDEVAPLLTLAVLSTGVLSVFGLIALVAFR